MGPDTVSLAIVAACIVLQVGATVALWLRGSAPVLVRKQAALEGLVASLVAQVETIAAQRARLAAEWASMGEELEVWFQKIESKRKSAAASASNLKRRQEQAVDEQVPTTRSEVIAIGRKHFFGAA